MNKFFVGIAGEIVTIMKPIPPKLSKEDAINLAAWLVAVADDDDKFPAILDEIRNS